jgi:hypothetical protein
MSTPTLPTFLELLSGDCYLQVWPYEILPLERQPHLQLKYMYFDLRPALDLFQNDTLLPLHSLQVFDPQTHRLQHESSIDAGTREIPQ